MWGCAQIQAGSHWLHHEQRFCIPVKAKRKRLGNFRGQLKPEQLTMFSITARTCRSFTLAEVLIMAAMNVENRHSSGRADGAAPQKG
jgi:hypothetical protein